MEGENIVQVLEKGIFVGGERSYGFGRICKKEFKRNKNPEYELKNRIFSEINKGISIRSHLKVEESVCTSEPSDRLYQRKTDAVYQQGEIVWIYVEAYRFKS